MKKHEIGGLIISPTRELASQISQVLAEFLKDIKGLTQLLTLGGNPIELDVKTFNTNGANILVATPGRLEDLLTRKIPNLNIHKSLKSVVSKDHSILNIYLKINNFENNIFSGNVSIR